MPDDAAWTASEEQIVTMKDIMEVLAVLYQERGQGWPMKSQ